MKKLLLSFLLLPLIFIANAQDAKPTKEQTINYLKQNLLDKKINHLMRYTETGTKWDAVNFKYNFSEVSFNGCILTIKYSEQRVAESNYSSKEEDQPKIVILTIDLSKTESVSFSSGIYKTGSSIGEYLVSLNFKEQLVNGKIREVTLPFISLNEASFNAYEKSEDQVYKAFNHLRKLCGAPEPIKFQ
ncbi:MAG TPA: hypothetical protein VK668_17100 [Mucilaginibacter sp.]|nr:hypothetical protein [Mucilaginibacter sp.]